MFAWASRHGGCSTWRSRGWLLAIFAALAGSLAAPAGAIAEPAPSTPFWRETYAGADLTSNVWLLYSGVTLAPMGDIHSNGLRLRASGGYGQYGYSGRRSGDPINSEREFRGTIKFVEALIGYQARLGDLTAKAFAGIAAIDHVVSPDDPIASGGLLTQGLEYGFKGVLELWLNLGADAWTSLDASWTSAHQSYAGRWRLGYRVLPTISLGVETSINGNLLNGSRILDDGSLREELRPQTRLGLFARYEWYTGEISVSGGITSDNLDFSGGNEFDRLYATVNWLTRF